MHTYKVGDSIVHWIFGIGKITAIADKGSPGHPCFYYIVEGRKQTLWVPVEEIGRSSLHSPISRSDFKQLIQVLRSLGEELSNNSYQRQNQLDERVKKASPKDLCLVIRDLIYRSHGQKLNSNDLRILRQSQSLLLDEWERSLDTPREQASREMEWILKENQVRRPLFAI